MEASGILGDVGTILQPMLLLGPLYPSALNMFEDSLRSNQSHWSLSIGCVIVLVSLSIHDSCSTLSLISLSSIFSYSSCVIIFLIFSSHIIPTFLPLHFSPFSFKIHTKQQGNKIAISYLDKGSLFY